jgi:PiT family inorganic phosphate transporter
MDLILILIVIAGFYMAWNIGANDTANSIGTSVGSGVLSLRAAILRIIIFDLTGAVLYGHFVTRTVGKGIVNIDAIGDVNLVVLGALAALLAASIWITLATLFSLPVSTTHSIVGAMLGFGLVAAGFQNIKWIVLGKIVLSWVLSPLAGALTAFILYNLIRIFVIRQVEDKDKVENVFGYLQISTAMFVGFAIGSNDVANAVGPIWLIFSIKGVDVGINKILAIGGIGIVVGAMTWGYRVIETIGKRVTEVTPTRGFAAEFSTASIILANSFIGLPISTTHVLVGSVIGVGFARGMKALDLGIVSRIIASWIITVPATSVLAIIIFTLIS